MHEIAGQAEFAIGTLYKFFQNKEDLYHALVLEQCDRFEEALAQAIEEPGDEVEKLRNYVRTKSDRFRSNLPFVRLFLAESRGVSYNLKAGLNEELRRRYYDFLERLASIFERGIKTQRFKNIADPYFLAAALDSIIDASLLLWLDAPSVFPIRKIRTSSWIFSSGGCWKRDCKNEVTHRQFYHHRNVGRFLMHLNKNGHEPLKWSGALLALMILLGGCGSGQGQQGGPPPVPEVATVTIQPQSVELTTELPGRTSPFLVAEIRPQVNGIIKKRLFREGSDVKVGQLLYQIDPAPFQVALDSARASLGKAQANLPSIRLRAERYQELLADKAVSRQDLDDAAAAVEQARAEIEYWKAAVEGASINLGYTRVTAPISGRIGKSSLTDGALVTAYQPAALATIQQLDPIYVDVSQSSAELLRLKRHLEAGRLSADGKNGRKVRILLEDGTPYPLEGRLQFRDITVDQATGSFTLRIVVPNPKHLLLPGMFVRGEVQEGIAEQAILAPQQGVSRTPKGDPVALVVDEAGKVQQRQLTLNRAIGDKWLVSSGLAAGDRLIVEGMMKVRPGAAVKAVAWEGPKPGAAGPDSKPQPAKAN
jgi:membrane fusion protein, multidrug efflux system